MFAPVRCCSDFMFQLFASLFAHSLPAALRVAHPLLLFSMVRMKILLYASICVLAVVPAFTQFKAYKPLTKPCKDRPCYVKLVRRSKNVKTKLVLPPLRKFPYCKER